MVALAPSLSLDIYKTYRADPAKDHVLKGEISFANARQRS
jgi:hypothetical protein